MYTTHLKYSEGNSAVGKVHEPSYQNMRMLYLMCFKQTRKHMFYRLIAIRCSPDIVRDNRLTSEDPSAWSQLDTFLGVELLGVWSAVWSQRRLRLATAA